VSCKSSLDDNKEKYLAEENRIISQLFCELVKPSLPPPLPGATDIENKALSESQKRLLDTTRFEVHLSDTLYRAISSSLTINDSLMEFREIFERLLNDSSLNPRKLNNQSINIKCNYKLITTNTVTENSYNNTQSKILIGTVSFSRVSFNSDFTQACFQMSLVEGRLWAFSEFVFAVKQTNEWKILKTYVTSVS